MTGSEVIKRLMEIEDVTNAQLANRTGVTQATLWARLNNQSAKGLPVSVFSELLDALGYEIVVRKRKDTDAEVREFAVQLDEPTKPEGRGRPRIRDTK